MAQNKEKKKLLLFDKIIIFSLILLGLLVVLAFLVHNAQTNYQTFKENKNYFKTNPDLKVEDWMNPMSILRHFNISEADLFTALGIPKTESNLRTPLREICKKQKVDCNELIKRINSLIK